MPQEERNQQHIFTEINLEEYGKEDDKSLAKHSEKTGAVVDALWHATGEFLISLGEQLKKKE